MHDSADSGRGRSAQDARTVLRKEQNLRMAQVPPQIFISYRREDGGHAGRLHADLAARFGEDAVFYDLHGIPAGVDFAAYLRQRVAECRVVVAVIGRFWSPATLYEKGDYLSEELATAFQLDKVVIPVLVPGGAEPRAAELPAEVAPLASRQYFVVSDRHWKLDVEDLAKTLAQWVERPLERPERVVAVLTLKAGMRLEIRAEDDVNIFLYSAKLIGPGVEPPFNVFPMTALQKGVTLPLIHSGSYSFRLDTIAPQSRGKMTLTMRSHALAERYRLETSTFAARFLWVIRVE